MRQFLIGLALYCLVSCQRELYDQPIPPALFPDIIIDLSFPEYVRLLTDGGTFQINNKGVRGIILYRKSAGNFIAFEKNCSYHPADACATVEVDPSRLFLIDFCCGSTFSLDEGIPTGGVAWRPLRQYKTSIQGFLLTISSESLNGM
jgi:nitrite reductase/ring-hydroxylating ferredoxin subunit